MGELARRQKLAAMGVPVWYSRFSLPGAAPSPEFLVESEAVASHSAIVDQSAEPTEASLNDMELSQSSELIPEKTAESVSSLAAGRLLRSLDGENDRSEIGPSKSQVPLSTVLEIADEIPSHLSLFTFAGLVVINERDESFSNQVEANLLNNILLALKNESIVLPEGEYFSWPIFANPKLPCNLDGEHGSFVATWLAPHIGNAKGIIYFGGEMEWLESLVNRLESPKGWGDFVVVEAGYSLAEMLVDPNKKPIVWRNLRAQQGELMRAWV